MKVIYCEFHQSLARSSESRCDWSMARGDEFYGGAECRMVPMRLIPDNAETADRESLAGALDDEKRITDPDFDDYTIEVNSANFAVIYQAAIRQLAAIDGETP